MQLRVVSWFSCGAASAVTAKVMQGNLEQCSIPYAHVIARCVVPEEHPDNDRFAKDCEPWFGQPVLNLKSEEFTSCEDVWRTHRYMSGVGGARCTVEMKKAVRWAFEADWHPNGQAFGYTADEAPRAARFRQTTPEVRLLTPLIDLGLTKADCFAIVTRAGLRLPEMYRLGFANANCIGCVKAESEPYWNRVRRHFPEVFAARAALSRELGVRLLRDTKGARRRFFLDEIDPANDRGDEGPSIECGLDCAATFDQYGKATA